MPVIFGRRLLSCSSWCGVSVPSKRALLLVLVLAGAASGAGILVGCKGKPKASEGSAATSAEVVATVIDVPSPRRRPVIPRDDTMQIPIGPRYPILDGQGVGPIRIGANVATIERHMQAPCGLKTPDVCRYFAQAVEFKLKDGVTEEIVVHRRKRPAGKDASGKEQQYGVYNGGIPADPSRNRPLLVAFGMHEQGVAQGIGKPLRVEPVTEPNPNGTVARHYYDGMVLEYDTMPEAKVPILGSIRIVRSSARK